MNANRYPSDGYFGDYHRLSPTSPFLPFSSSSLLSARNTCMSTSSFYDDSPDVNENQDNGAMDHSRSKEILASSESLLASFMNTVDKHRLERILDEQKHIPPGVRYVDFPTKSAHEDHTSETIYGMDMHSLRVGDLINDAIISAFAKIAFANSPFWQQRSIITPYLSKQAEIHPERYGREAVMRWSDTDKPGSQWLPTPESRVTLVPYSRSLHWTLAVLFTSQHKTPRALHQNSLKSDFGHRSALSSILHHCKLMQPNTNLQSFPGPRQEDGHNCGTAVCLAIYIWLMHPDPITFNWERLQEISPGILDKYRNYILYVVATGDIENVFDGENETKEEAAREAAEAQMHEEAEHNDATDCMEVSTCSVANHSCYEDDDIERSDEMFHAGGFQPLSFETFMPSVPRHRTMMGSITPTFNNRWQEHFSSLGRSLIGGFFADDIFSFEDQFRNDSGSCPPFISRKHYFHCPPLKF